MNENEISKIIVECAIEVHRTLGGPGLLEALYEEAMVYELELRGLSLRRQVAVPVTYKGKELSTYLRLDLLVAEKVIVECKATLSYNSVFEAQLLTYLRLTGKRLGMVINFGEAKVIHGIHRVVNNL